MTSHIKFNTDKVTSEVGLFNYLQIVDEHNNTEINIEKYIFKDSCSTDSL